tara:strand:+ start:737 stop:1879 length:1143 start_codon:yes stop_codon:yes gene_type:complete
MKNNVLYLNSFCLLMLIFVCCGLCKAQTCDTLTLDSIYDPGAYSFATLLESDGIRNGPDYAGATIYYPTNGIPPYPAIAICPGHSTFEYTIQAWGPFYASHGIVTITIGTNSIYDYPDARKNAILDALETVRQENVRSGSPLFGYLDLSRLAVSGWSMGGGGAQLAAAADTTIKAVVGLCPWLESWRTAADLNHPVPTLILSGQIDAIAPPYYHADVHYGYIPSSTEKLLYEIAAGDHWVANGPGGGSDYAGKMSISWLKTHLLDDNCYCPLLLDTPSTASKFLSNINCPATTSVEVLNFNTSLISSIYPNPASDQLYLELSELKAPLSFEIYSHTGIRNSEGTLFNDVNAIDISNFPVGMYFIKVFGEGKAEARSFVVN